MQRHGQDEGKGSSKGSAKTEKFVGSSLWRAAVSGDEILVRQLLEQGEAVDERHLGGWTPLMGASELGLFKVVSLLLDHRADVDASNKKGRTAVSFAAAPSRDNNTQKVRPSQPLIIQLLADRKADLNRTDQRDESPLDKARWEHDRRVHESREEAVEVLMFLLK